VAVVSLIDNQSRTRFFQETVVRNLEFWLDWLDEVKDTDIEALYQERNGIVRAILFALDLGEPAWSLTRQLVTAFSPYMERRGQWDIWSRILRRAIDTADRMEDVPGIANLSTLLARLLFWQNRFQESMIFYRRAIKTARQIGDRFIEARACSNLGYYYTEHGSWFRAEVLCCYALELFEQIDSGYGRAHTENHLGILCTWRQEWDEAQQHLERACAIWEKMADNYGLMNGYNNLGRLYNEMERYDDAFTYLERAVFCAERAGVKTLLGNIFINIGIAHQKQGNLAEAEKYFWQAEAIFQRYANVAELARVQDNLGLMYLERQQWAEAKTHLEGALATWHNLNNTYNKIQTLTLLAECEVHRGDRQQTRTRLAEAQDLLNQYGQMRPYRRLREKVKIMASTA
jgi:tetratricopeptide (TPR) repeat protein